MNHLAKINKVIILYASFAARSWNYFTSFGVENSFYDSFLENAEGIHELRALLGSLFEVHKIDQKILKYDKANPSIWKTMFSEHQQCKSRQ